MLLLCVAFLTQIANFGAYLLHVVVPHHMTNNYSSILVYAVILECVLA